MSLRIDWPIISSAVYPKTRVAAAFQLVMMPSRFLLRITSWTVPRLAPVRAGPWVSPAGFPWGPWGEEFHGGFSEGRWRCP